MYDGYFYDQWTNQMLIYDVGFNSMFVMEAEALAELADYIGRPEAEMLRTRGDKMRQKLVEELWDEASGIFVNKFRYDGFYRRITPTSFYPLLTGGPSKEQADEMMTKWLMNPARFCISPTGDYAGNSEDCYWGLPSISADDPAFPALGYWRGYVWGPMVQLTYWGLLRYDDVPSVRTARKSLCKQMTGLMLSQWNRNGHICENYGPHRWTADCTGNKFYHWGALAGFISLIEAGYYYNGITPTGADFRFKIGAIHEQNSNRNANLLLLSLLCLTGVAAFLVGLFCALRHFGHASKGAKCREVQSNCTSEDDLSTPESE
jgi:hypothetical protein